MKTALSKVYLLGVCIASQAHSMDFNNPADQTVIVALDNPYLPIPYSTYWNASALTQNAAIKHNMSVSKNATNAWAPSIMLDPADQEVLLALESPKKLILYHTYNKASAVLQKAAIKHNNAIVQKASAQDPNRLQLINFIEPIISNESREVCTGKANQAVQLALNYPKLIPFGICMHASPELQKTALDHNNSIANQLRLYNENPDAPRFMYNTEQIANDHIQHLLHYPAFPIPQEVYSQASISFQLEALMHNARINQ